MNIKKNLRHLHHTKPLWYKKYHKWKYHEDLRLLTFAISLIVIVIVFINVAYKTINVEKAHASTTHVSQDVTGGSLTISNSGNQSLSSVSVSTNSQNSTGSLGTITVVDDTGTGNGWNATATSTDFYKVNSAVKTSGSNNTVTTDSGSTYVDGGGTSLNGDIYTITITTTGGGVGVAKYSVTDTNSDSGDQTDATTGSSVAVGSYGVTVTFATATYVIGDSWTIRVDVIPVTGFRVTPVDPPTSVSGSITNVTGGTQHTFTATNDQTTIMTATSGYGLGQYTDLPALRLTVPANSYANTYTATVTETVS